LPTRVFAATPLAWPSDTDVLAVDLDVRERSDAHAAAAVRGAADLAATGRVFVKIDSTLRGPIRGLISGALSAFGREIAIVAPAFPEQGRHYVAGRLHVDGRPGASLHDLLSGEARCRIVDSLADAASAPAEWLLVGSAGLARHLAPRQRRPVIAPPGDGPVLVVAGSPTAVTRSQLDRLTGLHDVVVLATDPTQQRDSGEAAAALAARVSRWAQRQAPRAVVLTGGATARAVIHRQAATSLRLVGELEPGIPVGQLEDGIWHGMLVVTKAGGFGHPDTLLDVVHALGVSSNQ